MSGFKDHFSHNSAGYASSRPDYPESLFSYLADLAPGNNCAWDCATGTGQSARQLQHYFSKVIATDASASQINSAHGSDKIEYLVSPAEQTPIKTDTVDLVTVSQALHWFNIESFFSEAERVLKNNGILAVWSYSFLTVDSDIDQLVNDFYHHTLNGFWPEERKMVETGYATVIFPFQNIEADSFSIKRNWSMDQLLAYLDTWSAVEKFKKAHGYNPLTDLKEVMLPVWRNEADVKPVSWPVTLHVCRK